MHRIIDFHTHAFPDDLAKKAMAKLHTEADVRASLDGTLSSLLASMDNAGIEKSVICCIATKPSQFDPVFNWCRKISSERIIPFPSVHPDDPDAVERLKKAAHAGFLGVKFHPFYQNFVLDDPRMDQIYSIISELNLLAVFHTGFDIAFEKADIAGPQRILNVLSNFPKLKFIATHLGGWQQWDQVEKLLLGKPIYTEISWSYECLGPERFRKFLLGHDPDYLLFGTDSPWTDQAKAIKEIMELNLSSNLTERLFYKNAQVLLRQ